MNLNENQLLSSKIKDLPVFPYLEEIAKTLKCSPFHSLVLSAETGAGKSTAVPAFLLSAFKGKILLLESRRLAAVSVSERISFLLGEETGKTAGYSVHLDSKKSGETRLEAVTEALLIKKLQADPLLEDINLIIIDEFHERSVYTDLALAFLKETMLLRDDLYLLIMSATIDYRPVARYLGNNEESAPVMNIPGRTFPVEISYNENLSVTKAVILAVSELEKEKSEKSRSVLVFLPGIFEIKKIRGELENENINAEILILHSSVPLSEQRKVLNPDPSSKIRVILSSAVAETSVTVPDTVCVIDSGLCRINKIDLSTGMEKLVTQKESLFSAEQRSGRAGRIQKGKCLRLWNKNDARILENTPAILRSDLTELVLECAARGNYDRNKLDWLNPPPESKWNAAVSLLKTLGCLTEEGRITQKGKAASSLGLHPRLSCVSLSLFNDKKSLSAVTSFTQYKDANESIRKKFEDDLLRRLKKAGFSDTVKNLNPFLAGFPDRLSHLVSFNADSAEYQLPSARKAGLKREVLLKKQMNDFPEWIISIEVSLNEKGGKIYNFETVSKSEAEDFISHHQNKKVRAEFYFDEKDTLRAAETEIISFGEIVLSQKKKDLEEEVFKTLVPDFIKQEEFFTKVNLEENKNPLLNKKCRDFLLRTEFFITHSKDESVKSLENRESLLYRFFHLQDLLNDWLLPFINGKNLDGETVYNALFYFLDGNEVERNVPLTLTLENGRRVKVLYNRRKTSENDGILSQIQPSVEIIIQKIFGCLTTPRIMGGKVLLKLLSPASRPLQITDDLENFWKTSWIEICKEMKGRYPKHNWDYKQKDSGD